MRIDGPLQRKSGEIRKNDGERDLEERGKRFNAVFHDQKELVLGSLHNDVVRFGAYRETNVGRNGPGRGGKDELSFKRREELLNGLKGVRGQKGLQSRIGRALEIERDVNAGAFVIVISAIGEGKREEYSSSASASAV